MGCDKLKGNVDISVFKAFADKLNKFNTYERENFFDDCAKELAARLLGKVVKRTPVGDYKIKGKKGGTLRRGWTGGKKMAAKEYADSLKVNQVGNSYVIEIINPTSYSEYVEYGHRTRNHKGWVAGRFMMTISLSEIDTIAPAVLEKKLKRKMEEMFR